MKISRFKKVTFSARFPNLFCQKGYLFENGNAVDDEEEDIAIGKKIRTFFVECGIFCIFAADMNKQILRLAVPSIISNITVPLLGFVDVTITGHMGDARYMAAIAVGAMLFNIMYWMFSFLRFGTGGLTAQAFGKKKVK